MYNAIMYKYNYNYKYKYNYAGSFVALDFMMQHCETDKLGAAENLFYRILFGRERKIK